METVFHTNLSHRARFVPVVLVLAARFGLSACAASPAVGQSPISAPERTFRQMLQKSGVPDSAITGVDRHGVPMVCGTGLNLAATNSPALEARLPAGTRSWGVIPSVIRDDGVDACRLEIDVNGIVQNVRLSLPVNMRSSSGLTEIQLQDDGQGLDRVAGDGVYTSEALHFNPAFPPAIPFYLNDSNSPPGLAWIDLGSPRILELDGTVSEFLIRPQVGLLAESIAPTPVVLLATHIQATPHLVNLSTSGGRIEQTLRSAGTDPAELSRPVYAVLPDDFDFLLCIPSDHVEYFPVSSVNFVLGLHVFVSVGYAGTGQGIFNYATQYGSAGRLKGINLVDTASRGVHANNATHELTHQWAAFLDFSLGLNLDGAHYKHRSSVGSLVGGQLWDEPAPGVFVMNCDQGRNGAHRAPPLDRYLMGLEPPENVPVSRVYSDSLPGPFLLCGQVLTDIVTAVNINQIILSEGPRVPGPEAAQRDFQILFVTESGGRLFTATEMTFYDILAEWYTRPVPAGDPDPYLTQNWVSIRRFFGEDVTWQSRIDALVRPKITGITLEPGGNVHVKGQGFPGATYEVLVAGDLVDWRVVSAVEAGSNGTIDYSEQVTAAGRQFFRLRAVSP